MDARLSNPECDKVANEIAEQEYAKLLKLGNKNELRTWFIATSTGVCDVLANKFGTHYVAFYHKWNEAETHCMGTLFIVKKYKSEQDHIGECLFKGFAKVPEFDK